MILMLGSGERERERRETVTRVNSDLNSYLDDTMGEPVLRVYIFEPLTIDRDNHIRYNRIILHLCQCIYCERERSSGHTVEFIY